MNHLINKTSNILIWVIIFSIGLGGTLSLIRQKYEVAMLEGLLVVSMIITQLVLREVNQKEQLLRDLFATIKEVNDSKNEK